nr:hypothetical protein [Tanacetum cinerariifolium]
NDFIALCFKHGWKDAISSGIRILVLTSASSSYYLRGRIRMHSPSGAFPCLMLKKDDLITHNTVIIKNHCSNGAALEGLHGFLLFGVWTSVVASIAMNVLEATYLEQMEHLMVLF